MDAFGGDSPLSEVPSSTKYTDSAASASPIKADTKTKSKAKPKPKAASKSASASASASRRSSRVEERSTSPDKPSGVTGIKIKFTRPPSPEKLAAATEEQEERVVEPKQDGKRGNKRKSEGPGLEGEVREAMAIGKGKKAKITHVETEVLEEPKKKNVAIKRKGGGGKSSTDLLKDLFDDEDDDEEEASEKTKQAPVMTKPAIKIKGKTKKVDVNDHVEQADGVTEGDGDDGITAEIPAKPTKVTISKSRRPKKDNANEQPTDELVADEIVAEMPSKATKGLGSSSSSRARQGQAKEVTADQAVIADQDLASSKSSSNSKKRKADQGAVEIPSESKDDAVAGEIKAGDEAALPAGKGKSKGNKKKDGSLGIEKETESVVSSKPGISSEDLIQKADNEDIEMEDPTKSTADVPTPDATIKAKKSFAQIVAGSPLPPSNSTQVKKDKKPIPSIAKFTKNNSSTVNTPDKRTAPGLGIGTGTNTPTATGKKLPPAIKKAAPSLLESTMASLLGGHTVPKATPKKEEPTQKTAGKPTPVVPKKGEWADTWDLNPTQQREFMESKSEREEERGKRLLYRKNPVNLQEAKDSYRLDSTKSRVIPALAGPDGGLGIRTKGAPSRMIQALIDRTAPSQAV